MMSEVPNLNRPYSHTQDLSVSATLHARLHGFRHTDILVFCPASYSTLGEDAVAFVVDHSEMTVALASVQVNFEA